MSTPTLYEYLSQKLEQKRKEHPSFRLMKIDDRLFPNAQTKHSTLVLEARNSNDELKTVAEIVAESWKKGDKNHLMIEGEGGIGKTVTLLSIPDKFTPFPVPAIYIPLHELPQGDDPIERYIKKKVLNNKEDLFGQLLDLLDNPWDKGPQLLLLLDGFNEIAAENRQTISEDIKYWSEFQGIQIVTSSRYDIHTYVALSYDYSVIKLQPLSNTTVDAYLKSMKVRIPTDSAVKELITIPLLLTLYVKTELILKQRETDSAEFRDVKNAGSIVWNYLQCELWRFGIEDEDAKNAIIAMEFIAPYMAWQMQQNSMFVLDKKDFHKFLDDAYKLLENHFNKLDDFPFQIKDVLQKADGIPPLENIRNLLEKHLCLFVKNGNSYRLMHQQFRDALAAIHLINLSYLNKDHLPQEWEQYINSYVIQFVADLISEDEANHLWERNRMVTPAIEDAIRNQLRLHGLLHNNDYSHLDFSGLDLNNISLYPYRSNNITIKLPTKSNRTDKTKFSEKTFSPEGHEGSVNDVSITPNEKYVVSGSDDCTVRIWDIETGENIKILRGHKDHITSVAVLPNGKRVVSGSKDRTLCIWDIETGKSIRTLKGHKSWVTAVSVTPNGKHVISGSKDRTVCIWDIETGEITNTLEGHKDQITSVTVMPDGNHVVSASRDGTIRIWNIETGEIIKTLEGHGGWANVVSVTQNGRRIISGSKDCTIRIWDLETGENIRTLKGSAFRVKAISVTPNEKQVISGAGEYIARIWDMETGELISTLKGHKSGVNTISVTPNGKQVISGASDGTICIWNLKNGEKIRTLEGYENKVNAVAVMPDGKHAISGFDDCSFRIWKMEIEERNIKSIKTIKTIDAHKGCVNAVAIIPNGNRVISGSNDSTIRIWDIETGENIKILRGRKGINSVAVTSDGELVVNGANDRTICIWDLETSKLRKVLKGHNDWVSTIAIMTNGKHIVSGSKDHTIRMWDIETGENIKILRGHKGWVTSVALTSDEKHIISGSSDRTVRIWKLETGDIIQTLNGHESFVTAVAIMPDGKHVVSGSGDRTIRIWNLTTSETIKILEGHEDLVTAVAITTNGKQVISGSGDCTIRIWDLETDQSQTIHILPLSVVGLDFSKAIISTPELKETLRQNGAKVDPD